MNFKRVVGGKLLHPVPKVWTASEAIMETAQYFGISPAYPETVEKLALARFAADCRGALEFLQKTTHPQVYAETGWWHVSNLLETSTFHVFTMLPIDTGWCEENEAALEYAMRLERFDVMYSYEAIAKYKLHSDNRWYQIAEAIRGEHRAKAKPDRNDQCPCGSGSKYKRCCLAKQRGHYAEADLDQGRYAAETT